MEDVVRQREAGGGRRKAVGLRRELPREAPGSYEVRVLPDLESLAEEAARQFADEAGRSIRDHGLFRVALAGGSTPRLLHERLVHRPWRSQIRWDATKFFFGDERCVPPDNERSNYRMAKETLFAPLKLSAEQIFRLRGEAKPRQAAAEYETVLKREFAGDPDPPRFDLVLLGLGADGHTASLFPSTRALSERRRYVVANYVPKLREWRVTLTFPVLNAVRGVLFLAAGREKSGAAAKILRRERGYRQLPASLVRPRRGSVLWLLDEEAGKDL